MFISIIVVLAVLGSTVAKLDLSHPSSCEVESFGDYVDLNGAVQSYSGAIVIDGVSQANHLSMDCNNKFCLMMEYFTSCKGMGMNVKKICSLHLLGYRYGCNAFPPPPDVVNAPSICIPSALKAIGPILNNPTTGLPALLGPYLAPTTFATNVCGRNCFKNFQYASHDFFSTCRQEINSTFVPLAALMSGFQEYRNQACSENPSGANCYASVMSLVPTSNAQAVEMFSSLLEAAEVSPEDEQVRAEALRLTKLEDTSAFATMPLSAEVASALASATPNAAAAPATVAVEHEHKKDVESHTTVQAAPPFDLFNFNCDYGYGYPTNQVIKAGVCAKLSPMKCCAATGITMLQQNPVGSIAALAAGQAANPVVFPPCLVKYMEDACPTVDLANYCTNGSIASNSVIKGTVFIPGSSANIPNMYSKTGTLTLATVIQRGIAQFPGMTSFPFLFTNPLQIQIMDYTYYNALGVPLTPSNGSQATPYASDWSGASAGNFTYQIINQDLTATTAGQLYAVLAQPGFKAYLNGAFLGNPAATGVKAVTSMMPEIFEPVPLVFDKSAAAGGLAAHRGLQWFVTLAVTVCALAWGW